MSDTDRQDAYRNSSTLSRALLLTFPAVVRRSRPEFRVPASRNNRHGHKVAAVPKVKK